MSSSTILQQVKHIPWQTYNALISYAHKCLANSVPAQNVFVGTTSFDLKRTTVVCLGHRLSKHKMTKYARNLVGAVAPWPPMRMCLAIC